MSNQTAENSNGLNPLDAPTFASTLGQAVWLMTMSPDHKDLPIRYVEQMLSPAILLKQFRLFSKGKQPVAMLVWASVSDDVKARLDTGDKSLELKDWRSGNNIVILDCISPFNPANTFEKQFLDSVKDVQSKTN